LQKEQEKEKIEAIRVDVDQVREQRIADREAFKNTPLPAKSEDDRITTVNEGLSVDERMKNQIIYKIVDEDGVARYATDRHGLTCFVDLNFPENKEAYTQ